ncbi:hypothetical protein KJ644_03520 [Candidatus Dependentiae bacterium]|nr:hypothetical protein [Candidatus Dependentiae bacterium]
MKKFLPLILISAITTNSFASNEEDLPKKNLLEKHWGKYLAVATVAGLGSAIIYKSHMKEKDNIESESENEPSTYEEYNIESECETSTYEEYNLEPESESEILPDEEFTKHNIEEDEEFDKLKKEIIDEKDPKNLQVVLWKNSTKKSSRINYEKDIKEVIRLLGPAMEKEPSVVRILNALNQQNLEKIKNKQKPLKAITLEKKDLETPTLEELENSAKNEAKIVDEISNYFSEIKFKEDVVSDK